MKKLVLATAVCLFSASLSAASRSSDAIIRVLNSRTAGSAKAYARAVEVVAADAKAGKIIQQYLIALLAREKDAPEAARIPEETRSRYMANSRDRILAMAKDRNNAMAWYLISLEKNDMTILKHAADLGNVQALNTYATIKMSEALDLAAVDSAKSDLAMKECFAAYTRAAEGGDANALNSLAICYQNGYGCEKDETKAFRIFFKAAEKRHPEAVNNLGRFYLEGIGVPKDSARAFKCFEISASLGNVWGVVNRATALLTGEGCKKDHALAVKILEEAASGGAVEAMDFLANAYDKGVGGLKKDSYKTLLWKLRARAARGDENAKNWLKANKAEL